jgi:hypothetical protein
MHQIVSASHTIADVFNSFSVQGQKIGSSVLEEDARHQKVSTQALPRGTVHALTPLPPPTLGGKGAKSYDGEKARSSINHSIFSDYLYFDQKVPCNIYIL